MNGELVFIRLVMVGRYIDLKKAASVFNGTPETPVFESKDTPVIYLPKPLAHDEAEVKNLNIPGIKSLKMRVKLYEDGIISLITRMEYVDLKPEQLHNLKTVKFTCDEGTFDPSSWMTFHFNHFYPPLQEFIDQKSYVFNPLETEEYTCFCFADDVGDPYQFIQKQANTFASILLGQSSELALHSSQITSTLSHPFSFLKDDMVIFDYDNCIIFDPKRDYEDIIFIAELGNYQMLNMRCLDRLLDQRLDVAEDDIRSTFIQSRNPLGPLSKKLGEWLKLRYDMIFILENLQNVSKIIGDFYLAEAYTHLCHLFQLDQWGESIRSRIETLGEVYSMAHSDVNDRIMFYLEVMLSIIFVIEFVLLIFGIK
jgi:hypothetical protein